MNSQDIDFLGGWGFNARLRQIQSILRTWMRSVVRTERWENQMNILKDISGERYPLAPLDEDGEEGTTASPNEDDKNGTDP